ncbi:MAG: prepilin-type N-terminal cleavage/methylation domain-containing protein [Myxococcota bacterium]
MVSAASLRTAAVRRQRGFTLIEVLVTLLIFAISVAGLVALESRSIDSQRAASQLREAERVAQQEMSAIASRGFLELIARDFAGNANPTFPYTDDALDPGLRQRDFHRPPADIDNTAVVMGEVRGQYLVSRRIDWIVNPLNPPSGNPPPELEWSLVNGVEIEVTVLWIDDTNPAFPPPATLRTIDLTPAMTDPASADFSPFVGRVRLRTVRVNDAVLIPPAGP